MKRYVLFIMVLILPFILISGDINANLVKLEKKSESAPLFNYRVVSVSDLCIGNDGSVFVLDGSNRKILKFSSDLKYLLSFGKRGQGPGEFNHGKISVGGTGDIFIVDSFIKVIRFSSSGNFQSEVKISGFVSGSFGKVLKYPVFFGRKMMQDFSYIAQVFNIETRKILTEQKLKVSGNFAISMNNKYIAPTVPFVGGHSFWETNGKYGVIGEGEDFNVRLINEKGEVVLAIKKDIHPIQLSGRERKYLEDKMLTSLPGNIDRTKIVRLISNYEKKNFIAKILLSGRRIYVFPVPKDITVENRFPAEVYNFKGKLVQKIWFPRMPEKIKNNFAFMIEKKETEDDEEIRIVKYAIK